MENRFYTPLGELLDKTENSLYKLVALAARRAQAIADGSPKLIAGSSELKPGTAALKEIAQGKVRLKE